MPDTSDVESTFRINTATWMIAVYRSGVFRNLIILRLLAHPRHRNHHRRRGQAH